MEPSTHPRYRISIPVKDRTNYEKYTFLHWEDTPYPTMAAPTPPQAEDVANRLLANHGDCQRPAHHTAPKLDVAGCGEVPQVLDAIIRTMISADTTFAKAGQAIHNLWHVAGTISEKQDLDNADRAHFENCLDYKHVLTSMTHADLALAIKPTGGQNKTAAFILALLAEVLVLNRERTDAFREEMSAGGTPANPDKILGADLMSNQEKRKEIQLYERGILHLEFLKKLPAKDAMNVMLGWKGVGVKTGACVLLFCMRQDILATDTHCIRLSKWLGWAPLEATDNLVFAHVNARVPDRFKYILHQLLIQHGQDCLRCRDNTTETTPGWDDSVCVLEDLLDRNLLSAYKAAQKVETAKRREAKEAKAEEMDEDAEDAKDAKYMSKGFVQGKGTGKASKSEAAKGQAKASAEDTVQIKNEDSLKTPHQAGKRKAGTGAGTAKNQQVKAEPEAAADTATSCNGPMTRKRHRAAAAAATNAVTDARVDSDTGMVDRVPKKKRARKLTTPTAAAAAAALPTPPLTPATPTAPTAVTPAPTPPPLTAPPAAPGVCTTTTITTHRTRAQTRREAEQGKP